MVVLGIDPGTARLGYGVVRVSRKDNFDLIESDVLVTAKDLEPKDRLFYLYENLTKIIKKYSPDIMVVERLFFNTNTKTAIAVGQARGIVLLAAASTNTPIFEHTALEAKLVLTGYGRSDKKVMQEAVRKFLKLKKVIKSDDANDAVAMALCYVRKGNHKNDKKDNAEN
ncbi:MAG: crossover junction endodeoxyribonuclease RuvC [Patescibacteria group bacterium]|nr:MAG: crossover junction endodeoxyribonuclease RuvC [Patescibacteria group bacterium]